MLYTRVFRAPRLGVWFSREPSFCVTDLAGTFRLTKFAPAQQEHVWLKLSFAVLTCAGQVSFERAALVTLLIVR